LTWALPGGQGLDWQAALPLSPHATELNVEDVWVPMKVSPPMAITTAQAKITTYSTIRPRWPA
jgi:hypothetical protein